MTTTAPGGASATTSYVYDGNGNRTLRTRGTETTSYTYDAQDRLTRAGTVDFSYDANGQLTRRQDSANTTDDTRYGYDAYGQLRDVTLPDGRALRYVLDGAGRRVGKKVDGQLAHGFLYSGDQLVAELNPDNSVKSRFVYATRSHVPDYMVKDGINYRLVTDELGSPRLVVNAATGESWRASHLRRRVRQTMRRSSRPFRPPAGDPRGKSRRADGHLRRLRRDGHRRQAEPAPRASRHGTAERIPALERNRPPQGRSGDFSIAGAGFEPATFGL